MDESGKLKVSLSKLYQLNPDEVSFSNMKDFSSQSFVSNVTNNNLNSFKDNKRFSANKSNSNGTFKFEKSSKDFSSGVIAIKEEDEQILNSRSKTENKDNKDYVDDGLLDTGEFEKLSESLIEEELENSEDDDFAEIKAGKPDNLSVLMKIMDPFYNIDLVDIKYSRYQRVSYQRDSLLNESRRNSLSKNSNNDNRANHYLENNPDKKSKEMFNVKNESEGEIDISKKSRKNSSPSFKENDNSRNNSHTNNELKMLNKWDSFGPVSIYNEVEIKNILSLSYFNSTNLTLSKTFNIYLKYSIIQSAFSFKILGIIGGSLTMIIVAIISNFSVYMLIQARKKTKIKSYLFLMEGVFGEFGMFCMLVLIFIYFFGQCLCYSVAYLKSAPRILVISSNEELENKMNAFHLVLFALVLILSYKKDLSGIKKMTYYSYFGVIGFFIFTITDFFNLIRKEQNIHDTQINLFIDFSQGNMKEMIANISTAISCIFFNFSYHLYTLSLYDSMDGTKSGNERLFMKINFVSILVSTFVYVLTGTIGYLLYPNSIKDTMLDATGKTTTRNLLGLSTLVSVLLLFPITFNALKHSFCFLLIYLLDVIKNCVSRILKIKPNMNMSSDRDSTSSYSYLSDFSCIAEFVIVILLLSILYIIIYQHPPLIRVFSVVGGTFGSMIMIILPSVFYIKYSRHEVFSRKNIIPMILILIGLIHFVICIISNIFFFPVINIPPPK